MAVMMPKTMPMPRRGGGNEGDVGFYDLGDSVDLGAAADAEGGQSGKQGEDDAQPLHIQAALQSVHGAALHPAVRGFNAVLDGDQRFGILGGDAEHAGEPAP